VRSFPADGPGRERPGEEKRDFASGKSRTPRHRDGWWVRAVDLLVVEHGATSRQRRTGAVDWMADFPRGPRAIVFDFSHKFNDANLFAFGRVRGEHFFGKIRACGCSSDDRVANAQDVWPSRAGFIFRSRLTRKGVES